MEVECFDDLEVIRQKNGSVSIGLAVISEQRVRSAELMQRNITPAKDVCSICRERAMYETDLRQINEDLVLFTFTCAYCGHEEYDYLD